MEDLSVRERLAFTNVGLPNLIGGLIVEVFRSKSSGINGPIAWITLSNDVLLNELHDDSPCLLSSPLTMSIFLPFP